MKRIIGIIILVLVFALLIGVSCAVYGFKTALITWAISLLLAVIILIAIFLIEEGM